MKTGKAFLSILYLTSIFSFKAINGSYSITSTEDIAELIDRSSNDTALERINNYLKSCDIESLDALYQSHGAIAQCGLPSLNLAGM